ncbi:hypothetical protein RV11_GL001778 [Enterococcus phoeniculicola]|uniref:Immunity protein 30 domain-containing protein n=1 Tax=Enterococcus phoeniculicola ATCC BAA-412 TaxID=1158610 RepID=R3W0F3_9ENTE|nr:hypothetical protein [Enterococcus phoeniculicola]EOL41152.1 hypothetical protein UC3_03483 [Enterococcus phoeniculicola ATCC BAA-412]EOT78589.1 hypothetical protein I589_00094 [Enterococcus phoeniculicola ATCC BAA-412]OJG69968.1 hypothetical protein RV11_GL001778 [Enterococcus phoeniculicola]
MAKYFKRFKKSKNEKLEAVGYIRDVLDYGDEPDDKAIEIINNLAVQVTLQDDNEINESILNAMLEGSKAPDVEKSINLTPLINHLNKFNDECLSYILSMLGYSGNVKYKKIIESYKDNFKLEEDVEEALLELDYRIKKGSITRQEWRK